MNIWTKKSIEVANASGYLDKLHDIYTMHVNIDRPLTPEIEKEVRQAYSTNNIKSLVNALLKSEIFPIKDSYIGFLKQKSSAINENPETLARIGKRLMGLGIDRLIQEATRPKETNRQLGQAFRGWLRNIGYPILSEKEFDQQSGPAFLEGGDSALKKYAIQTLGCTLTKGIDFVFKKNGEHLIGEAKFITTPGGEQNGSFADVQQFIGNKIGKARRVALLDGYIWLPSSGGIYRAITDSEEEIFSALLFSDFIHSL